MHKTEKNSIKQWAEDDRPREKMLLKGKEALSDAELIAILIGSGNRKETAVDLSKRVLKEYENNLKDLGRASIKELTRKFSGIGEAKAISILAAIELGRRRGAEESVKRKQVTTSKDVFEVFKAKIGDLPYEEFWIVHLSRANKVIGYDMISRGGVAGTVADAKLIFKKALENVSSSIILCHNHPSGNLRPSSQDIALTKKLIEAGKVLDIAVLDHLIITESGYFSFADEGQI
ncbi:MAG: DNA repair protein RadC [Bacteroidota bacterium]